MRFNRICDGIEVEMWNRGKNIHSQRYYNRENVQNKIIDRVKKKTFWSIYGCTLRAVQKKNSRFLVKCDDHLFPSPGYSYNNRKRVFSHLLYRSEICYCVLYNDRALENFFFLFVFFMS